MEKGFPMTLQVLVGKTVETYTGKYVAANENSIMLRLPNGEYKGFYTPHIISSSNDKAHMPEHMKLDEDKSTIAIPKIARP